MTAGAGGHFEREAVIFRTGFHVGFSPDEVKVGSLRERSYEGFVFVGGGSSKPVIEVKNGEPADAENG